MKINTSVRLFVLCAFIISNYSAWGQQVPNLINYQTILRNNDGEPLANQTVAIRFTILQNGINGDQLYREKHIQKTTNQYGLLNLLIGSGEQISGINFKDIPWQTGQKYLAVSFDPNGTGNSWIDLGTTQLLTVPYAFMSQHAQLSQQLASQGAQNGQVLQWDQTLGIWKPVTLSGGSIAYSAGQGIMIDGNNIISLAQQGATDGMVLTWNSANNAWRPEFFNGADNWGTQFVRTGNALTGKGLVGDELNLAKQNAANGDVLRWNDQLQAWLPGPLTGGANYTAGQGINIAGNIISLSPLNATNGQVLKWNSSLNAWLPQNDQGLTAVETGPTLSGTGVTGNPIIIAKQNAQNGDVLKWNDVQNRWIPQSDNTGNDNWGTQVVQVDNTLTGAGTNASKLSIAKQNANNGDVLKWNNALNTWTPAADAGGISYSGQKGILINGDKIELDPQGAAAGQVLKWNASLSAWKPDTDAGDNWGTQNVQRGNALTGNGTVGSPLNLAQQGASTNQVLKWNGSAWIPGNDSIGRVYKPSPAIAIVNDTLRLAQQNATAGQVLKWNATLKAWLPQNDSLIVYKAGQGITLGVDNRFSITPQTSAQNGYVLKWNNAQNAWLPQPDNGTAYVEGQGIDITGTTVRIDPQNAANGQVLKWQNNGWYPANDESGTSQWQNFANDIFYANGRVGVGVTAPQVPLDVSNNNANGVALRVSSGSIGISSVAAGGNTPPLNSDIGVYGSAIGNQSAGVMGYSDGLGSFANGIWGVGLGPLDNGVYGIADPIDGFGLYGSSQQGNGLWAESFGNYASIVGYRTTTNSPSGLFFGNVSIVGSISKGGGTFKIDHPQDPANKFLYHSFVESPDMMNIYNGNIVTDGNGYATVTLPSYFDTLNKDYRYQLTCIGSDFAQAIVASKIRHNSFVIRTDKPGIEVSWQVTGIRKDRFAQAYPVVPEVEKNETEKGKYLHPELFGQPASQSIYPHRSKRNLAPLPSSQQPNK